jgi:polysaccharide export outer membrane protein
MGTDEEPYKTEVKIAPDGTISVSPIGVVQAEGLTIEELNEVINQKERKFVDNPQMTAILTKERIVYVHVLGEVENPGLYSDKITAIPEQKFDMGIAVTLSASQRPPAVPGLTVLTAIQMAGGVKDTADIRHVKLIKVGDPEQRNVDLWRLLVEGDYTLDFELRSGDTIYIPRGGAPFDAKALGWSVRKPRPIRVIGEVNRPGLYYLGPDDDLITILAKAGGFDAIAKQRYVLLSRQNHDGTVTTRAVNVKAALRNHDKAGRIPVMSGDVVIVDASVIRKITPLLAYMALVTGTFTLLSVVSAALPVSFMHNLTRGQTGSSNNAGYALFGLNSALNGIFGYGVRQQSTPPNIP